MSTSLRWDRSDEKLKALSFPDEAVLDWYVNADLRAIKFTIAGAYIEGLPHPQVDIAEVSITGWKAMQIQEYLHDEQRWIALDGVAANFPNEVNEFVPSSGGILLRGFGGNSGRWIEVGLLGPCTRVGLTQLRR